MEIERFLLIPLEWYRKLGVESLRYLDYVFVLDMVLYLVLRNSTAQIYLFVSQVHCAVNIIFVSKCLCQLFQGV